MKLDLKNKAVKLRKKGFSFREISEKLGISKSTASLWLRDVQLTKDARERIQKLGETGRKNGVRTNTRKRKSEDFEIMKNVRKHFSRKLKIDSKIACALLYWCEGSKNDQNNCVSFMNSDPQMIRYFMRIFREAFDLDESKFRGLIHLHKYHDPETQLNFWSSISGIPKSQFNKSYLKKNSGKNKKDGYPGCLSIRYFDSKIYRELIFIIERLNKV